MSTQFLQSLLQQKADQSDRKCAKPSMAQAAAGEREVHFDNDPAFAATWTVAQLRDPGNLDPDTASNMSAIKSQIEALKNGDLSHLEAILYSQVVSLNAMFADCLARSARVRANGKTQTSSQLADDLAHLGIRAQDGCRKTIATIAELRNPKKTTFVKHQQNLVVAGQPDNTHQIQEAYGSEAMDTRTARSTETSCLEVATLEVIDGADNTRRQTKKRSKLA